MITENISCFIGKLDICSVIVADNLLCKIFNAVGNNCLTESDMGKSS